MPKGSSKPGSDSFMPKHSALLADMEERGPMRSAAFRDMRKLASRFGKEELWETAGRLLDIIRDKEDDPFERIEAIRTIVPVMNAIRGKIVRGEHGGTTWSAESQVPVQEALPKVHPGALLHASAEEEKAEQERFERREIGREQTYIGSLNAVALVETFDNKEIADAVRFAISKLDSPHAKKLVNKRVLGNLVDPLEKRPDVRAEEPSEEPRKPKSIEEIFDIPMEEDFSDVG